MPGPRLLIFEEVAARFLQRPDRPLRPSPIPRQRAGGRHHWREHDDTPTRELPLMTFGPEQEEPRADTAAEQDHEDPWALAGEDCGPPPSSPEDRAGVA